MDRARTSAQLIGPGVNGDWSDLSDIPLSQFVRPKPSPRISKASVKRKNHSPAKPGPSTLQAMLSEDDSDDPDSRRKVSPPMKIGPPNKKGKIRMTQKETSARDAGLEETSKKRKRDETTSALDTASPSAVAVGLGGAAPLASLQDISDQLSRVNEAFERPGLREISMDKALKLDVEQLKRLSAALLAFAEKDDTPPPTPDPHCDSHTQPSTTMHLHDSQPVAASVPTSSTSLKNYESSNKQARRISSQAIVGSLGATSRQKIPIKPFPLSPDPFLISTPSKSLPTSSTRSQSHSKPPQTQIPSSTPLSPTMSTDGESLPEFDFAAWSSKVLSIQKERRSHWSREHGVPHPSTTTPSTSPPGMFPKTRSAQQTPDRPRFQLVPPLGPPVTGTSAPKPSTPSSQTETPPKKKWRHHEPSDAGHSLALTPSSTESTPRPSTPKTNTPVHSSGRSAEALDTPSAITDPQPTPIAHSSESHLEDTGHHASETRMEALLNRILDKVTKVEDTVKEVKEQVSKAEQRMDRMQEDYEQRLKVAQGAHGSQLAQLRHVFGGLRERESRR